jgi:hypothetical protein
MHLAQNDFMDTYNMFKNWCLPCQSKSRAGLISGVNGILPKTLTRRVGRKKDVIFNMIFFCTGSLINDINKSEILTTVIKRNQTVEAIFFSRHRKF